MKLGLAVGYWGLGLTSEDQLNLVRAAEEAGWDSVWAAEAYGSDTATVLAWLASQTSRIKIGSGIFQMPGRTPAMTAMTAATLDILSNGRVLLGIGSSGPGNALCGAFSAALTADTELLASPALNGLSGSGFRPGVGPGLLLRLLGGERTALLGTGTWRWLPAASPETSYEVGVEARLHLGPVSLAARWRKAPRAEELGLLLFLYRD